MRFLTLLSVTSLCCTETISIEPVYTGDTDWVPTITIVHNNYQRVQLEIEQPPRLQLERNLVRYIYQLKKLSETAYTPIDTTELAHIFRGRIPAGYTTAPVLLENETYSMRVVVQYRNEIERTTNEIAFTTPLVKGNILQRVVLSEGHPDSEYGSPYDFGFGNGYLYVISSFSTLLRMDLSSGDVTLLAEDVYPVEDRRTSSYGLMPVFGDRAVLTEHPESDTANTYLKMLNLHSLEFERTLKVPLPTGAYAGWAIALYSSSVYLLWTFSESPQSQIVKVDAGSGAVVETSPPFTVEFGVRLANFAFDGSDLWYGSQVSFDNRILRFDPAGGFTTPEHRNPIYRPTGLAWDGTHFWVYESETNAFVKLQLEGL